MDPPLMTSSTFLETSSFQVLGQLDCTYVLYEEQWALVIVDQHALHERLGFNALKKQCALGAVAKQMLLIPEQFQLSVKEVSLLEGYQDILWQAGFEVERFGPQTFLVKAVPEMISNTNIKELLEKIANDLELREKSGAIEQQYDRLFALIACHRQIRGGERLEKEEMHALLSDMQKEGITHCPHGRPVAIKIDKAEIERRFKRT